MKKPATPPAFVAAFDLWVKQFEALDAARLTPNRVERARLIREARRLQNKVVPAASRAAARARKSVLRDARNWFQQHGFDANITECIKHLQEQGSGMRYHCQSRRSLQLGESDMRKILRKGLGIKGKPGRPKRR